MMDESENNNVEEQVEPLPGSGSLLATARKSQNRTVEEIADELNLSVTQIKTIELDQSEGLPEPTYVRGYIRSYAKLLNLDPETVLENYLNPNWQQTTNLEDMPRGISGNTITETSRFWTPAKVIGLLAVVLSAAFLWYSGMLNSLLNNTQDIEVSTSSTSASTASQVVNTPANDTENNVAIEQVDDFSGDSVNDNNEFAEQVSNQLLLNFVQTSWVDIRDSEDNRLAYKSYAKGEQLNVSTVGSMSVFIGNADGVTAIYNGSEFDISPHREGVYAKFTVGEEQE